ncbi:hypothetical protein F4778DRAFT_789575 [Xylariomycetidae sp. FL2044]|nr:hypothetical protein F4778DRAFT_789575 [Xylariomycetidae sp. FL2044]
MAPAEGHKSIHWGVDLGTTFSKVSWYIQTGTSSSNTRSLIEPEIISQYPRPKQSHVIEVKRVPTVIRYDPDGEIKWGFEVEAGSDGIRWFKLVLLNEEDVPAYYSNSPRIIEARKAVRDSGKDEVEIIGDFLKKVWNHALELVTRAKGESVVNACSFHVVMSVPAFWKPYAREKMQRAADLAGILKKRDGVDDTTLEFVSEPEAAALASKSAIDGAMRTGDTFIVCDSGGGTTDVISYQVTKKRPLTIKEATDGDGRLAGGVFADQGFLNLLQDKMTFNEWKAMDPEEINSIVQKAWEDDAKRYFDGQKTFWVDLPRGIRSNKRTKISLEREELRNVFEPVMNHIKDLVKRQGDTIREKALKPPRFIILVGGFTCAVYVKKSFDDVYDGGPEIVRDSGDRPETAIVRGAAIYSVTRRSLVTGQVAITSRVARLSYGWKTAEEYDESKHHPEDFTFNTTRGTYKAEEQMAWGEDVSTESKTLDYDLAIPVENRGIQTFSEAIYSSPSRNPSVRYKENVRDSEFKQEGTLKLNTVVPVEKLPRHGDDRHQHYLFDYKVHLDVSGASLKITASRNGSTVGEETILGDVFTK